MPLALGTRLGPYEILAPIGAGGMGEVYRARDTTLDREVAIKVLPAALAQDPERLARFRREAKVLASLNHPNIAQIYGVEDRALVMELVAGALPKGPLPLEAALSYARQIAMALEAAHEKGIIHRDLKPANIMITAEGMVKVLDFGLAAVAPVSSDGADPSHSPTLTMPTQAGMIMGTAAYMSPEQAAGKPVDKRADIWSFGVVLWEFLAGRRLFEGETVSHTLADVLRGPIDFDKLPRQTPPEMRGLLRRCLDRNVKNRLRDIGEARVAIDAALGGAHVETSETLQPPAKRSIVPWAVAAASLVAVAIAGWGWLRASRPTAQPPVRVDVDLGPEIALRASNSMFGGNVTISPDGTRLVYVASASGRLPKLFTRRLDQPNAVELPGTEHATNPFFSPDGQWVGFVANNKLNKISVEGGATVLLGDVGVYTQGSWGDDGNIIVSASADGKGLMRVPSAGGAAEPVTELAGGELLHADPRILPGGKAVLFTATADAAPDKGNIEVASFLDRHRRTLVRGGYSAHYVATPNGAGFLVFISNATLFAVPFDLNKLETRGTPVPVLEGVANVSQDDFDISQTGTLVFHKESPDDTKNPMTSVEWVAASGRRTPLLAKPGNYRGLRLSPDGERIVVGVWNETTHSWDFWVYEPDREAMTRLTFGGRFFLPPPMWSPDGRYVIIRCSGTGLFWARADGADQPQQLTSTRNDQYPTSFSPDGKRLAYFESGSLGGSGRYQIWTVPIEDGGAQLRAGKPEPFLQTQFSEVSPTFSPDGKWVAYVSNESGKREVYVQAFTQSVSGHGGKWQISNGGGASPRWPRKSRELFYSSDDQIMAVSYTVKGDAFVAEKPRVWLSKLGGADDFDVSPDGKHLAVLVPVETPEPTKPDHEITLIFNFLDELRRKVPVGK